MKAADKGKTPRVLAGSRCFSCPFCFACSASLLEIIPSEENWIYNHCPALGSHPRLFLTSRRFTHTSSSILPPLSISLPPFLRGQHKKDSSPDGRNTAEEEQQQQNHVVSRSDLASACCGMRRSRGDRQGRHGRAQAGIRRSAQPFSFLRHICMGMSTSTCIHECLVSLSFSRFLVAFLFCLPFVPCPELVIVYSYTPMPVLFLFLPR